MHIDQAGHDGAVAQVNYLVRLGQIRSYLALGANRLNSIATDRYETSNGRSPVPVKTLLDVRTVKQSDITTTYTGSMPEIAVTIRPKTTMKMKNFQMVFHHWPNEILATARPATVMPATGLMVLMV